MKVRLYQFSKRNKSSMRPIGNGSEIDVELKDESTVEFPELIFTFEPLNHNYIYIPKWNRYYFKTEDKYYHGRWFIKYTEDYLATWKTDILASRSYVLYDVNEYDIVDKRLPALATPTTSTNSTPMRSDFGWSALADGGTYVVTVTGTNGVCSYSVSSTKLNNLLINFTQWFDTLFDQEMSVPEAIVAFCKQLLGTSSASDNIKSCVFLPMTVSTSGSEEIHLGLYDTNITAGKLGVNPLRYETTSINIPWQANDWRRNTPYTQLYLYIPFVGMVSYSTSDLLDKTSLDVQSCVNCATGEMSVLVKSGTQTLGTYGTNIAANIPIGSSGVSPSNVATSIIKATGAIATGGVSTGTMLAAGADVMTGLEGISSTVGGMGGGTASRFSNNLELTTVFHNTLVDPSSVRDIIGCPSMFVKSLSGYSGYIQTAGFQISCCGTASEKDMVNQLMDSGVYIE